MARRVEEGDLLPLHGDAVGADVLRDAAGLARGDVGVADGVQQARFAVVDMPHHHDDRRARLEVLLLVRALVEEAVLDGQHDLLADLDFEFVRHEEGRVVVDDLIDRHHQAHAHQLLDDLARADLHPRGKLPDGDLVRHGDGKLHRLRLEGGLLSARPALVVPPTAAAAAVRPLVARVLFLDFLLADVDVGRLGYEVVELFVVFVGVDVARAARIDHAHLGARALLLRLPVAAGLRLPLIALGLSGRFGLRALGLLLGLARFFLFLVLLEEFLDVDLVPLCDVLENEAQLVWLQRGHRAFLPLARSAQQVRDLLRFHAEVLRERVDSVFVSRCCHSSHQSFLSELRCVYGSLGSFSAACR